MASLKNYLQKARQLAKNNQSGLLGLLITWLAFFSRTITGRFVYFLDDLKIIYYPLEHAYAEAQAAFTLPVWNNFFGFGQPLLAWAQLGFFTPVHVILRFLQLHPLTLLQVSIVTYFGLGLLGTYLLLKHWRRSNYAALLGAVVLTFNGFNIGHLNHVNFYTGTMLLPWLILTIDHFLQRPTINRLLLVTLFSVSITLGAQPQVVLYTHIIAGLFAVITIVGRYRRLTTPRKLPSPYLIKLFSYSAITILLITALSSFTVLPLFEFLPQTERAAGIDPFVLYEFSYPSWNAITLILPYFFGNRAAYWGPKGLQELAAFTGLIPLMLAGLTLIRIKQWQRFHVFAFALIITSIMLALGRYSIVYSWLVENHIITSISVPGRFVFFFTTAIALIAPFGLDNLIKKKASIKYPLSKAVALPVLLLIPFFVAAINDAQLQAGLLRAAAKPEPYLILVSLLAFSHITRSTKLAAHKAGFILAALTILALLHHGWNFNPLTSSAAAYNTSPITKQLQEYQEETGQYPRLYSRDSILQVSATGGPERRTDEITPDMSIHQPFTSTANKLECIIVPIWTPEQAIGTLQLNLSNKLAGPPLRSTTLDTKEAISSSQRWCFEEVNDSANQQYFVSITTDTPTNSRAIINETSQEDLFVYLVRKSNPTPEQLLSSRKPFWVKITTEYANSPDSEALLLARHLNVIADTSSARWIGALSFRNYREFIEEFFANDRTAFDGDNRHVVEANRKLFNLAGVTHFTQQLDVGDDQRMIDNNFSLVSRKSVGHARAALYTNPEAFPKAFVVPNAVARPAADEARGQLRKDTFNPRETAIVDGPTPPDLPLADLPVGQEFTATSTITNYQHTTVTIDVTTNKESVLILNDMTTPEWHTTINGQPAPQYVANTIFKAAIVPPGNHTVTFNYHSPAIAKAKQFSKIGLLVFLLLALIGNWKKYFPRLKLPNHNTGAKSFS